MAHIFTKPQRLWLEALRSGEYSQGKYRLQSGNEFCCLGVACEVAEKAGIKVNKDRFGMINGITLNIQPNVIAWLGLRSSAGEITVDEVLTRLNDSGQTFFDLADLIERNASSLFI